eukprot:TRINITY_DN4997_c0_g5_i3.p1 TRINITY_DN4997_c0_g5~~TRINITY_DN4997_c0_g5_i3.p1  ORF type:complete len:103 (-),score=24.51 TRINITY_DN4997_c0_g5_i3:98-406(-)
MVCANCEKKLSKSVVPEVRKAAEMAKEGSTSKTGESAGRKVNPNMLLSKTKRFTPYSAKCKVCKCLLHQQGIYCLGCAYKAGLCSMCGVKILDTSLYKQSST